MSSTPQPGGQQPPSGCAAAAPSGSKASTAAPASCTPGNAPSIPTIEQATATVLTNIRVQRRLRCDLSYLKHKPGILKILQILACILSIAAAAVFAELTGPFGIVAIIALIITSILLIMYLIHFIEKYYRVPWLHLELAFCLIAAILFLVGAIMLVLEGAYPVAAFGFIGALLYGYDAFIKCIGVKNYAIAQGERTVVTKTTHFSGPASNVPPLTSSMINIPPIQICMSGAK